MNKQNYSKYGRTPLLVLLRKVFRRLYEVSIEFFTVPKLEEAYKHLPFSGQAMQKLLKDFNFSTILDIGSGEGLHSQVLMEAGKSVTAIDYGDSIYYEKTQFSETKGYRTIVADFNEYEFPDKFDAVWCSHVLEHQLNPNFFLKNIYNLLVEGGVLCITVPPGRNTISGGHVSNWNAGLLLYNLVLAGFNCQDASILKYGYNISLIITKRKAIYDSLSFDSGDLRKIKGCLPKLKFYSNLNDDPFNGNIYKLNW